MKIVPPFIYCAYLHIYDDGEIFYGDGKISKAVEPKDFRPFTLQIVETFKTYDEARRCRMELLHPSPDTPAEEAPRTGILCVQTGWVFKNCNQAGIASGAAPSSVTYSIQNKRPTGGLNFERIPHEGAYSPMKGHAAAIEEYRQREITERILRNEEKRSAIRDAGFEPR